MKSDREQSFKKHNYVHCVEVSGIELPVMILIFVEYPVMKYITSGNCWYLNGNFSARLCNATLI